MRLVIMKLIALITAALCFTGVSSLGVTDFINGVKSKLHLSRSKDQNDAEDSFVKNPDE